MGWDEDGLVLSRPQSIQIIPPCLHHLPPIRQSLSPVVRRSDLIPLRMRELQLDEIRVPAQLIETGAGHGAEAVGGHFVAGIAEAAQGGIHRVHGHRPVPALQGREDVSALAGDAAELPEEGDSLGGQRNDVPLPHLHALGRDAPLGGLQVDFAPFCGPEFAGTNKDERG